MTVRRNLETVPVTHSPNPNPFHALAGLCPPAWMDDALCAQVDPELFFPGKGGSTRDAKAVCAKCTVAAECLDYALAYEAGEHGTSTSYPSGIYGGLSERERYRLRKSLGASA